MIFNYGYGQNRNDSYRAYSYHTESLAAKGYAVVSIQHELSTDSLLPFTGNLQVLRRPFWERGAANIFFIIGELKRTRTDIDFRKISLTGHSNGGDMVALFPQLYPGMVSKIITLDNRRMALPRTSLPKVYSLRSSDQQADEGVLPSEEEQKQLGMQIVKMENTPHNSMDDSGSEEIH